MRLGLILAVILASSSGAQPASGAPTAAEMDAAAQPIREKLMVLMKARDVTPERYVSESIACAEQLSALADRFSKVKQSGGVRSEAISQMMKTADFVRTRMNDPRRAITIYARAAAIDTRPYPWPAGTSMDGKIADIQEYDLNDHAAAAATLRRSRAIAQKFAALESQRQDQTGGPRWDPRWFDVEIAFLEQGTTYTGVITENDLRLFQETLFFGTALDRLNSNPLGPDLDVYDEKRTLSPEARKHLFALIPSHSTFLRTWVFAARLTNKEDARRWLTSNDKAGFWRACLLALAAIADRKASLHGDSTSPDVLYFVRTADGKPNGFALLGREFAARNPLPKSSK
jgi:hypothetical protein